MDFLRHLLDLFLHLDGHLLTVIQTYGTWTYALLFVIVFCETGLVVTPFLPGDSLLFAAATFAAAGSLNIWILFVLFALASILGDMLNYAIGHFVGPRVFREHSRFLNKEHLHRTEEFYKKYGAKAIVLARFLPIIRTFAPFVAGIGRMPYGIFLTYNVIGGLLWTLLFLGLGFSFGNIPLVRDHFESAIILIILLSLVPGIVEFVKHRRKRG